jgi:cytochrome c556
MPAKTLWPLPESLSRFVGGEFLAVIFITAARRPPRPHHLPTRRTLPLKFAVSLAFAAAAAGMAVPALAQFAKPEDAVKYRQSAMFIMGQNFGRIGAMVNGKAPYDAQAAALSAEIVAEMSKLPWPGFVVSTEKITQTKAKPEIYTEQAKFKEGADKLQSEAPKLVAAAKTNNLDNLKAAFNETSKACKGCHDNYRNQ